MPVDLQENYLEWIDKNVELVMTYHRYKEKLAWTATAFYLPAIIYVAFATRRDASVSCLLLFIISAAVVSFFVVALCFVQIQFKKRWQAHLETLALHRARSTLVNNPLILQGHRLDYPGRAARDQWPNFVRNELQDVIAEVLYPGSDPQRTAWATYLAMFIATALAATLVWVDRWTCCLLQMVISSLIR